MKRLKPILPFAVILAAAVGLFYLPDLGPERYTDLGSFYETELHRQGFVGYTVAAVHNGSVVFTDAFGGDGRGLPLWPNSPMVIGSLSTTFTGLLTLDLAEEGLIDLEGTLRSYFPEFTFSRVSKSAGGEPTVAHLLSHASGYSDLDFDDRHKRSPDLQNAVAHLARAKPRAEPGAERHYIHTGYQALGLLAQRVTGSSYAELVSSRIFAPLNMSSSGFIGMKEPSLVTGSAAFFGAVLPKPLDLPASSVPSNGLVSTAPDLARYAAYLVSDDGRRKEPLAPAARRRLRLAPVPGVPEAYGWLIEDAAGEPALSHQGFTNGYSASATLWPESKDAIILLAPQNSLLQSRFSIPALVEGGRRILREGSTGRPFPLGRLYLFLAVAAAVHLVVLAAQTGTALAWARDHRSRADASGRESVMRFALLRSLAGMLARLSLLVFTPLLISGLSGRRVDWALVFDLEPGLGGWLVSAAVFGFIRNLTRIAYLRGPGTLQYRPRSLLPRRKLAEEDARR